jgi:hypothetical protein
LLVCEHAVVFLLCYELVSNPLGAVLAMYVLVSNRRLLIPNR